MRTKTYSLILALTITTLSYAQSPTWWWATGSVASGTPSNDEGESIAMDASGNLFITGFFQSSSISFGPYTFTKGGGADAFLAKYDNAGNLLWAASPTGTGYEYANDVAVDLAGNAYVVGSFTSPTLYIGSDSLTNAGPDDVFLIKYDPSGNVVWARSAGNSSGGTCRGNSVATDAVGNVYIGGEYGANPFVIGGYSLPLNVVQDPFLAKYDANGNVLWAKRGSGSNLDFGKSVAVDDLGNIYFAGQYHSPTITFDGMVLTHGAGTTGHVFLVKYDPSGTVLWASGSSGDADTYCVNSCVDRSGNSYVTGRFFQDTASFDGINLVNPHPLAPDAFLAKYDSSGNVIWATSAVGNGSDRGDCVIADAVGNVYWSGGYSYGTTDLITFGAITLPYPSGANDPLFVVQYDSSGNALCAFSLPTGGDDLQVILKDSVDNLYIGGNYWVSPFILGNDTLLLTGTEDVYLAKFNFNCGIPDPPYEPDPRAIREQENVGGADSEALLLMPNPFTEHTTIQCKEEMRGASLSIYNPQGQLVSKMENLEGNTVVVQRNNLNVGIYLGYLQDDGGPIGTVRLLVVD